MIFFKGYRYRDHCLLPTCMAVSKGVRVNEWVNNGVTYRTALVSTKYLFKYYGCHSLYEKNWSNEAYNVYQTYSFTDPHLTHRKTGYSCQDWFLWHGMSFMWKIILAWLTVIRTGSTTTTTSCITTMLHLFVCCMSCVHCLSFPELH